MTPAASLLTASAVRERAHELLAIARAGGLPHWRVDMGRLPAVAAYVLETMRQNYPTLEIPFHARWRHFAAGGRDRWATLAQDIRFDDTNARAHAAFDLVIVSVLLDAGAGANWRYREADGTLTNRSEGLAVASLDMFARGLFSAHPATPLRVDAARLAGLTQVELSAGFQAGPGNPLLGLPGRLHLLQALGRTIRARPDLFPTGRPAGLFDRLRERAEGGPLPAPAILALLLDAFGPLWPSRLTLDGVPLGDTWRHSALRRSDATDGLVPFHKLSQWLAYSLIEPLQEAGIAVTDINGLTGLPEYRNGGLLIDLGLLVPADPATLAQAQEPGSELIVGWRALTVALLDEIAAAIRDDLGLDAQSLPLARVLEGGTWAAGRRIARERRRDGAPPLSIVSDGTVF